MLKRKGDDKLGIPTMNITVRLTCPKQFGNGNVTSVLEQVKVCGMAIHAAEKILMGDWHVTEQGYLQRNYKLDLPCSVIVINIDWDNIPAVLALEKVIGGEIRAGDLRFRVHFHYPNGGIEYIGADEGGLYLAGIKQGYEYQQATRKILA